MKRERVPKEVWIGVHNDILYVGEWKSKLRHHRYVLPSRSTVEKKLRSALTRWIALEWQEFKGGEPVNLYALAKARIAVRDAFLRATRKDAR